MSASRSGSLPSKAGFSARRETSASSRTATAATGSRTDAVRYALLRTYRETLIEQAEADAELLKADVDDQARDACQPTLHGCR